MRPRPGYRAIARAGFFVGRQGGRHACVAATVPRPAWCMPARIRSQFGETSEALFLTQGYVYETLGAGRAALQERGAGLPVFALRQSDGRDVRGAHGGVRGRRGRARDRDRHGGGDRRAARAGEGGRSRGGGEAAVRLVPLRGGGFPAALRRDLHAGRRHRPRRNGRTRCGRTPKPSSSKARPIRISRSSTSPRWRRSRTRPARRWWSTTCSRRRCFKARSRSAPIASSIRRPSTSTARAAASAAWCWPRRNSSRTTCTI